MAKDNRIEILDSFRFIAILSVMLFHYYSRWAPPLNKTSLYPYGANYNYFQYGYLGVQFFFIISGFVIAFTLTKTNGFVEFWKKRMIRLFPAMFICSLVILLIFRLVDTSYLFPQSHSIKNFLFSLTFISPELFNNALPSYSIHPGYINGSYWSLWPEIQFYLVASCIYFINREKFVRNMAFFTILICAINYILIRILENTQTTNVLNLNISINTLQLYMFWTTDIFNYLHYSLYFLIGVLFFQLHLKEKKMLSLTSMIISICLLLFFEGGFKFGKFLPVHSIFVMIILFLCFLYFSKSLSILTFRPITKIGIASYSLYLIHENVGVFMINKYAYLFGKYNFLFPVLVILIMISFVLLSYRYIEKPIGAYLKKKII